PPCRRKGRDRVLEGRPIHDRAGAEALFHELDGETAGCLRDRGLVGMSGGDRVGTRRGQTEELEGRAHRVGGELTAARARAGTGVLLHGAELAGVDPAGVVRADGLEYVLNGEVAIAQPPRLDGSSVEDQ